MKFHDDIDKAFGPLQKFLNDYMEEEDVEGTLNQYQYMFHDDDEDDATYHYKHFGSRKYLKVGNNGHSAQGKVENWREWE